jgi:cobalt/nickel transport system permease protein
LKKVQEKTAFLPDYSFRKPDGAPKGGKEDKGKPSWPAVETGTSVSGFSGSAIVLAIVFLIGFMIRVVRKNKT